MERVYSSGTAKLALDLGVEMCDVAAVGDSGADIRMLNADGKSVWFENRFPHELTGKVIHQPNGDVGEIGRHIVINNGRSR